MGFNEPKNLIKLIGLVTSLLGTCRDIQNGTLADLVKQALAQHCNAVFVQLPKKPHLVHINHEIIFQRSLKHVVNVSPQKLDTYILFQQHVKV